MANGFLLGIDAGGTSFKCEITTGSEEALFRFSIPTGKPDETLDALVSETADRIDLKQLRGAGIACFGPLNLEAGGTGYGRILTTPKAGWSGYHIHTELQTRLNCAVAIDTDVGAALKAECEWGAAFGKNSAVYTTFATGIGAAFLIDGRIRPTDNPPEAGHIPIPRSPDELPGFQGVCRFHGDCFEGLASAPAIEARWHSPAHLIPDHHPAWDLQAFYIAHYCLSLTYTIRPQIILLGGGLLKRECLIDKTRKEFHAASSDYGLHEDALAPDYIRRAALGSRSGVLGGLLLAVNAQ